MDLSPDLPTAVDPPAPLLPLLTLGEAHDLLEVLAYYATRDSWYGEAAVTIASNLAARVPSRE